jgi:hypothetical protein
MQKKIREKCDEIRDVLINKNESYGNSVFERGVVFDVEPIYAIKARINDKLNRLKNNNSTFSSENDLLDLTGYLILLQVLIENVKIPENSGSEGTEPLSYEWTMGTESSNKGL